MTDKTKPISSSNPPESKGTRGSKVTVVVPKETAKEEPKKVAVKKSK